MTNIASAEDLSLSYALAKAMVSNWSLHLGRAGIFECALSSQR